MVDTSQIASEAIELYQNATNESRNGLRKLARTLLNDTTIVDIANKSDFVSKYGTPINKVVDMVHRHVLLDIITSGLKQALTAGQDEALTRNCFCRIGIALTSDVHCNVFKHTASRGFHKDTPSTQDLLAELSAFAIPLLDYYKSDDPELCKNLLDLAVVASHILMETCKIVGPRQRLVRDLVQDMPIRPLDRGTILATLETPEPPLSYDSLTTECARVVDDLCARYIKFHKPTSTKQEEEPVQEPVQEATHKDEPITVDPDFRSSVDLILNKATGGKITDIDDFIDAEARQAGLYEEIEELKAKAAAAANSFQKSGSDAVDGETLTYEVVMRDASEIFKDAHGHTSKKLGFEVVTLVWKDVLGQVVQHPDCPAIDPTYQFRMYMLIKFLSAIKFGHNSWLHGHTGTGKTTFIEQVAAHCGVPIERLNLDSNLERADVVGGQEITVEDGAPKTVYREGILPRAMQKPCWFICDEIDAGRADMLFVLQRALEGKGITITEDGGRVVAPHDLFRFVATANSRGQGDEFGFYAGVRPLNIAMLDRFTMFIEVPYLDKVDEMRLLKTAYPDLSDNDRNEFCEFSQKVRAAFINGEISKTLSPRGLHSMATYYLHFKKLMSASEARLEAAKVAVIDAAPADNRHTIEQMFNTLVG
tara:strand:+ start:1368 stop:3317 length:1950 start_codon:yes stop_codon:yes gene_type:complete